MYGSTNLSLASLPRMNTNCAHTDTLQEESEEEYDYETDDDSASKTKKTK